MKEKAVLKIQYNIQYTVLNIEFNKYGIRAMPGTKNTL